MSAVIKNALILIFFFSGSSISAQSNTRGDVSVSTDPEGAKVRIIGEVTVAGVTPTRFEHLLIGDYRLDIRRYGYENYSSRILIDPSEPMNIDVRLVPKTRLKAAVRSILVPGWGQRYFGKGKRGTLYTFLAVTSVAGYFLADNEFDDKFDLYETRLARYDSLAVSGTLGELRELKPQLDEAQRDAYDAENWRRVAIGSVVAVWSMNMLDVLFFSVPNRSTFSLKGVSMNPGSIDGSPAITLSRNF